MSYSQRPPPSPSPSPPQQDNRLPPPLDLSHHLSQITKRRNPSSIKEFYRYFSIPNIGNLGGGLPNDKLFPFDTLEAQAANPDRYPCTNPQEATPRQQRRRTPAATAPTTDHDHNDGDTATATSSHITVPKTMPPQTDPLERVDLSTALQYGTAGGYPPLLSLVRHFTRGLLHPSVPYRNGPGVILTCGSTDGFAKAAQLLADPWDPDSDPDSYSYPAPTTADEDDDEEEDEDEDKEDKSRARRQRWRERRPGMLCEMFVYNNALASVEPFGVQVVPVRMDGDGIVVSGPGGLRDILEGWDPRKGRRPHFMYTVTIGHNPTGHVVPLQRKREIYATCRHYDVVIVEDEPYWNLQFTSAARREAESRGTQPVDSGANSPGTPSPPPQEQQASTGYEFLDSLVPSYLSIDVDGRVIRLDTFSKTVAPGCRLGWITAQPAFIERLERITETTTQQPSGFVQAMIVKLLMGSGSDFDASPGSQDVIAAAATTTTAFSAFHRLSARDKTTATAASKKHRFHGWKMDGWVRWLQGLRGVYERRMINMCTCLDKGLYQLDLAQTPPTTTTTAVPPLTTNDDTAAADLDPSWGFITKTRIMSYDWPRGGMFVWVRIHFENHPLWRAGGPDCRHHRHQDLLDGPTLAKALLVYLTRRPHLVIVAPGTMFAATPGVAREEAWRYLRLCFGTEAEDRIAPCARRFVAGLQGFWRVGSVLEMRRLVNGEDDDDDGAGMEEEEAKAAFLDSPANLGFSME